MLKLWNKSAYQSQEEVSEENQRIRDLLLVYEPDDYGNKYQDHALKIYEIYVSSAQAISSQRSITNSFFVTLNTALLGVLAVATKEDQLTVGFFRTILENKSNSVVISVCIIGLVLCYNWSRLLLSYRQMNTGKFKVVHEMEKALPFSPYDAEWEALGRGKEKSKYLQFSKVERRIPHSFACLYLLLLAIKTAQWLIAILSVTS